MNTTDTSLVLRKLSTTEGAKSVFSDILDNNQEGRNALAALRDDPSAALALLSNTTELGLTTRHTADVVEAIIGEIHDPAEARQLVEDNLITSRRAELLTARGDLPSVLSTIVSVGDVHIAILNDLIDEPENTDFNTDMEGQDASSQPTKSAASSEEEEEEPMSEDKGAASTPSTSKDDEDEEEEEDERFAASSYKSADLYKLRPWAFKLKDRSDYKEILELKLDDDITIGNALVFITSVQHKPEADLELFHGALLELGIDADEGDGRELVARTARLTFNPIHVDDLIALRKELIGTSDASPNAQNLTEAASALI